MKARTIALALLLFVISAPACFAINNANIGTWKLNEAKSKLSPGAPKDHTVAYEAVDDSVKVTIDGVDRAGKPTHIEWTGKFDGKDYPVTGDPSSDARSYTKIDDRTLGFNIRKAENDVASGRVVVSADCSRALPVGLFSSQARKLHRADCIGGLRSQRCAGSRSSKALTKP
jgi:hypothetical protein